MLQPALVILTGAGISAESGIKTFRASDGLWENHRIEDVASPEGFAKDPYLVNEFYNQRRRQLLSPEVAPNPAHTALADLEKDWPGDFLLITQNIDDLHERAGSKNVLHMHGELLKARSLTDQSTQIWKEDIDTDKQPDLRPHIVWFGEMPFGLDESYQALENCDYFVSIGTSGNVYPAAGFVQMAKRASKIEVNLESTIIAHTFDQQFVGKASEQVPLLKDYLLKLIF